MNDILVPGWVFQFVIVTVIIWLIYLTVWSFKNKEQIALSVAKDKKHDEELESISGKIDASNKELKDSFDRLESRLEKRFDGVIEKALDVMKSLIDNRK